MLNRFNTKQKVALASRRRSCRMNRGQSAVEFALIATLAIGVMVVGVQFALIGQAALAVSQGSSALARYAAVNPGALGTDNGTVAWSSLPQAAQNLLSPSILTNTTTGSGKSATSTADLNVT